ncbi:hypothetical protein EYF80_066600 [Liparis tanakae]|uniref:Uncharacterized protein n=1 Tax=Liparis tanakae TaxID=230148 RepID=A0A4Z2E3I6_9TELE|nr:hypothetical protein EYF80_066600 [Liparis tanakae]
MATPRFGAVDVTFAPITKVRGQGQ